MINSRSNKMKADNYTRTKVKHHAMVSRKLEMLKLDKNNRSLRLLSADVKFHKEFIPLQGCKQRPHFF